MENFSRVSGEDFYGEFEANANKMLAKFGTTLEQMTDADSLGKAEWFAHSLYNLSFVYQRKFFEAEQTFDDWMSPEELAADKSIIEFTTLRVSSTKPKRYYVSGRRRRSHMADLTDENFDKFLNRMQRGIDALERYLNNSN